MASKNAKAAAAAARKGTSKGKKEGKSNTILWVACVLGPLMGAAWFVMQPSAQVHAPEEASQPSTDAPPTAPGDTGWKPPEGAEVPKRGTKLKMWDPVAINHTRQLVLDRSNRVYNMTTRSLDPPVFEIEDFLTDEECKLIQRMAGKTGMFKSDSTYLDASNLGDKEKNAKKEEMTEEEADALFRYSEQTWLSPEMDTALDRLKTRVARLAMLPERVSRQSEQLQVVKYQHYGHYESHYDSEDDHLGPCCIDPAIAGKGFDTGVRALEMPLNKRCSLCRFVTILYYLVDTEEGGGTVFPLADTTDEQLRAWETGPYEMKYKQTRTCGPGLEVKPKKRKAVLWYNHHLDRGYIGKRNPRSLHGGCNVIQGEKWIANHWISETSHPDFPRAPAKGHY